MIAALLLGAPVHGQEHGAARLHALVHGLTVTPRVLLIGARPSDADADLIAWLARGRHIQTGYLSLTRGESIPNHTGLETGATLGAIHVQEALAARRIDGGEQYFTRAYDFGAARNAEEVFEQWDRTELLGDVVAVVRSFRPHVIIAVSRSDSTAGDGQRQASAIIARDVFDAAADSMRFGVKKFGMPWTPASLFEPGAGVSINAGEYDHMLGRTYAEVAVMSRAQLRSFGFEKEPWHAAGTQQWRRVAARAPDAGASLFSGVDTSFMRLASAGPQEISRRVGATQNTTRQLIHQIPAIAAYSDSARRVLDVGNPSSALHSLKSIAELASAARNMLRGCRHPARDAAMSISYQVCRPEWLDLDASLDLVQRRAADAVFAAAGVRFEIEADREFLASNDTAHVAITVHNHGDSRVSVSDVSVAGGIPIRMTESVEVPPRGSIRLERKVINVAYGHPYWIWKRENNFYPSITTSLDGVARPATFNERFGIVSVAVPENIRRLTDVAATLTLGGATLMSVTASVRDVRMRRADPLFGVGERVVSGVPPVTLTFERALEWTQAGKPMKKSIRLIARSFADRPIAFALKQALPVGTARYDSLPPLITLAPHEGREITLPLRGTLEERRHDVGLIGLSGKDTLEVGFRTAQYSYLPPVHLFRQATLSVQAINVRIPSRLAVAYVRGAGDDADVALKQLGIPSYALNNEGLLRMDLDAVSTVVIGPDALRIDPGLITQMPRLMEFVRKGGTLVIMSNATFAARPGILPYPVSFADTPDRVTREDAPVSMLQPRARVLRWPNTIAVADWDGWVDARASIVPSSADPRYTTVIETHDPRRAENRNAVLIAAVGKGRLVYSSLALTQQISSAVPGAMRLFVNLLSAGLAVETSVAAAPQ